MLNSNFFDLHLSKISQNHPITISEFIFLHGIHISIVLRNMDGRIKKKKKNMDGIFHGSPFEKVEKRRVIFGTREKWY